MRQCIDGYHVF